MMSTRWKVVMKCLDCTFVASVFLVSKIYPGNYRYAVFHMLYLDSVFYILFAFQISIFLRRPCMFLLMAEKRS